jgi:hypothetical protein
VVVEIYLGSTDLRRDHATWDPQTDEVYDMRTQKQHFQAIWEGLAILRQDLVLRKPESGVGTGRRRTVRP